MIKTHEKAIITGNNFMSIPVSSIEILLVAGLREAGIQ